MGDPKLTLDTHHSLLEYQAFISSMVVDIVIEKQKLLSQQSSDDIISSTDNHPSMAKSSTVIPSMDTHYSLITSSSMDIPLTSQSTFSDIILFSLGTPFDEQLIITTLLGMSVGEKRLSKRLGCSQAKGELESERPLVLLGPNIGEGGLNTISHNNSFSF